MSTNQINPTPHRNTTTDLTYGMGLSHRIQVMRDLSLLSLFENGWRIPTPKQLKKLMKALPKLKEVVAEEENPKKEF